jgi:oligopeptide transport system substrate-binding protein
MYRMQPTEKFKVTTLISIFFLLAALLAACGGSTPSTGENQMASPDKQVLREPNEGGDYDTLDPALTNSAGEPINIIFTGLVTPESDSTIGDQLAASHVVSADGLSYTFTLRDNLKFSDGTALTADDVAYSINRTVLPATKSGVSGYLSLLKDYDKVTAGQVPTLIGDSIIVKDPKTIVLVISKPAAYFLGALSYPTSYVVNKKLIAKYGDKWTDHMEEGAGAGPFKVQSYGHTSKLVLVSNPNYYGAQPKLQRIEYVMAGDRDSNYKSFEAGQFDLAPIPPSQNDKAEKQAGYQQVPALSLRYIGMNYLSKPFDNTKIRQAFALAINKDLITKSLIGTFVTPSNHIVPNGIPGYTRDLTGPAGVKDTKGDTAKAKQLLQEGLTEAGYGSVSKLPTISLTYNTDYKTGADTMVAVINQWKEILGVTVKPIGVPNNELLDQENKTVGHEGPLQMWYGVWGTDYPDPQDWLSVFFGKGSDHNASNYGQNSSTDARTQQTIQDKLAEADGSTDQEKRLAVYQDAEKSIVNDAGWITTYQPNYIYSVNPKLKNWNLTPLGLLAPDDWSKIYFVQ